MSETKYSTDSERVFLIITQNTTETELEKIASEFRSESNIMVDYSKSEFNEDGTIQHLILEVDCNDGFREQAQSSGKILKTKNSGFSRDYSENSRNPFCHWGHVIKPSVPECRMFLGIDIQLKRG